MSRRDKSESRITIKSARLLTRDQRVQGVMKIIGKDKAYIKKAVDRMIDQCEQWRRTRSRESMHQKQLKKFAVRYGPALRKAIAMTTDAPAEFCVPPLPIIAPKFGIKKAETFDHGHLLRHLDLLDAICRSWEKLVPTPSAKAKRLATWAALHLCKKYGIKPVTTKNSEFCKLAAALYGDVHADLQHHCRVVLNEGKVHIPAYKVQIIDGQFDFVPVNINRRQPGSANPM